MEFEESVELVWSGYPVHVMTYDITLYQHRHPHAVVTVTVQHPDSDEQHTLPPLYRYQVSAPGYRDDDGHWHLPEGTASDAWLRTLLTQVMAKFSAYRALQQRLENVGVTA